MLVLLGVQHYVQGKIDGRSHGRMVLASTRVGDRMALLRWLDLGAQIDLTDESGQTALMLAADRGDIDQARALLDAGAEVKLTDPHGATALMRAVQSGNAELVALLIFWKADVNARRDDGATALTLARRLSVTNSQRQRILRLLDQAVARP